MWLLSKVARPLNLVSKSLHFNFSQLAQSSVSDVAVNFMRLMLKCKCWYHFWNES